VGDDPFNVRDPVFDVLNFFGRVALADSLTDRLSKGQAIGLFGLRKMGKSSLLRFIQGKLPFPTAWLDVQKGAAPASVYERILRAWNADAQSRFEMPLGLAAAGLDGDDSSAVFVGQTQKALDVLSRQRADARLGLLLDEIELILPPGNAEGAELERYFVLLRTLRGLIQEDRRVSLLVAGVNPAITRQSLCGAAKEQNPFFQLLQEQTIPPLLPADCVQMVKNLGRQVDVSFGEEAANYVAERSGGHPLMARQLCSLALKRRERQPGEILLAELEDAAAEFPDLSEYSSVLNQQGLWGDISNDRRWSAAEVEVNQEILRTVAASSAPVPRSKLIGRSADHRSCLLALRDLFILEQSAGEDSAYKINFGLFRTWIRRNRLGLED
jgi:hypothetical protein